MAVEIWTVRLSAAAETDFFVKFCVGESIISALFQHGLGAALAADRGIFLRTSYGRAQLSNQRQPLLPPDPRLMRRQTQTQRPPAGAHGAQQGKGGFGVTGEQAQHQ